MEKNYFNANNLSHDKRDVLIDSVQFYKSEVLKANGHNYNSFTVIFLNSLLEELKNIK